MLVFCIMMTLSVILNFVNNLLSVSIFKVIGVTFDILTIIGLWVVWGSARKNNLSTAGPKLILVPLIITFVFSVIGTAFEWIANMVTFNALPLVVSIFTFVVKCIYFGSIKKLLTNGIILGAGKSTGGEAGGMFAAVMTIIFAVFNVIKDVVNRIFSISNIILSFLSETMKMDAFSQVFGGLGGGMATLMYLPYIVIGLNFLMSIFAAVLIFIFNKRMSN